MCRLLKEHPTSCSSSSSMQLSHPSLLLQSPGSCGGSRYLLASPYCCGRPLPAFSSRRWTNLKLFSPASLATMPLKGTSLLGFDYCARSWDFGSWWPKYPHAPTHHSWMGEVLSAALRRVLTPVVDWCYSVFSGLWHTKRDGGGAQQR